MHQPDFFQKLIEQEIQKISFQQKPASLYDPIRYMISLGGKRLRPALLLMSNEMFGGDYNNAINPALGIEVFHNFTLLHDDIMDKAPLRRGKPTVHQQWNTDIAILSGDTMFVKASQLMMDMPDNCLRKSLELFYKTATDVCEGQQLDMDYEQEMEISIHDYILMIRLKTAVLLACSLQIGAILAGASEEDQRCIYLFGQNLGIAFQLHDDLLDVYSDEKKFGKQNSGDIIANKKTFLLLKALEVANSPAREELSRWISLPDFNAEEKINAVKNIYTALNIRQKTEEEMDKYFHEALQQLEAIRIPAEQKEVLRDFSEQLMMREV